MMAEGFISISNCEINLHLEGLPWMHQRQDALLKLLKSKAYQ